LAAVGERDDEAVRRSKDVDGCTVDLAGLSSDVGQDAEARKPASEQPSEPVSEGNVDLRQPSLAEPHQQHARGGDGDYDDGSDTHGSLALHNGIGFDLNQPIRVDEAHDLHDRVRRADAAKELAVDCRDPFPIFYTCQ